MPVDSSVAELPESEAPVFVVLDPRDNVAVLLDPLAAGERIVVGDRELTSNQPIQVGHKIATRAIAKDEKVLKYGEPIGIASRDIAPGDHVHVHNVVSGRLPGR